MDRHDSITFQQEVVPLVIHELIDKYGVSTRVFCDGHLDKGYYSYVDPGNNIVLDLGNIPNMVFGIQCLCHEYCHIWREAQAKIVGGIYQEIHDFYLSQCYEYKNHFFDSATQELLLYYYSLLELDARAFAKTFGTEYTDRYFSSKFLFDLREAYEDKSRNNLCRILVAVLRYLTDSDRTTVYDALCLLGSELATVARDWINNETQMI